MFNQRFSAGQGIREEEGKLIEKHKNKIIDFLINYINQQGKSSKRVEVN